jgi:hypothetical protein
MDWHSKAQGIDVREASGALGFACLTHRVNPAQAG